MSKKLKLSLFFSILFSFVFILNAKAIDQKIQLNKLFKELKDSKSNTQAEKVEQKIWKIWSTHPTNVKLTSILAKGSSLVNNNKLLKAIDVFSEAINKDPNWAEAWNKRATVFYMIGEYQKSQNDIDNVLKLEKRHFGAFAGQGLVNIKLKNYEKAIESYQKVQEIYPLMKSTQIMIKEIKNLIKKESI
tara:strand:+ start:121 stop:687 length:567 start_codon:yes stop_codon:yes gene_type:complete